MNATEPNVLVARGQLDILYRGPEYSVEISRAYNSAINFNISYDNTTYNASDGTEEPWNDYIKLLQDRALLVSFLLLFSLTTVFGNMLVILAVVRERYLHTSTNYFVTSLAVADCLVGLVVMPFSALYEVLEHTWFFGVDWCDVWRSLDVLFSTASILNLCVISLDRYWAITDPITYPMRMSGRKAAFLIAAVWVCSGAISFPAIAWWRAVRVEEVPDFKCPFTENLEYIIFSSTISFYLPLFVMVFTYYRIYRAATIQTRSLKIGTKQVMRPTGELELTLRIHRGGTVRQRSDVCHGVCTPEDPDQEPLTALQNNGLSRSSTRLTNVTHGKHLPKNFSLSRKLAKFAKEKKAAKTLGIVMGVFIVCWLPFFVVNLLSGICSACIAHEEIVNVVVTWLGWVNSSMNPVIYACWSRDFRRNNAVSPINQLLCALRFYATGSQLITCGDVIGVDESTACRIVHRVTHAIASLYNTYIKLPSSSEEQQRIAAEFYKIAKFPRVYGAIDCTHVRLISPGGNNAEIYRNRKGYFSINTQCVAAANLSFLDVVARWHGSAHDANIWDNYALKRKFLQGKYNNMILLGDSGYAQTAYMMTPLADINVQTRGETLYQESQIKTRNVVERAFGIWKRRFPILSRGISMKLERVPGIIVATAVLHNLAIQQREDVPPEDPEFPVLEDDMSVPYPIQTQVPSSQQHQRGARNVERTLLIEDYFARL